MSSPEIIAERAAEKRRLNPNYQPSLAELKAVDAVLIAQARARGFDVGTSPHGLPADLPLPVQETPEASSLSLHAKPLLTFPDPSTSPASPKGAYGHAVGFKRKKPEVYTSPEVRSACRCIREAAAKQAREGGHYLRLNDREFLIVYAAVEHDRNRTCKAIRKGFAEPEDLKSTDSIWGILQRVMVKRMKGYRL